MDNALNWDLNNALNRALNRAKGDHKTSIKTRNEHNDGLIKKLQKHPAPIVLQNDPYYIQSHIEDELDKERPVLCFFKSKLIARAKLFQSHFPGRLSYAVKANSSAPVLKTLDHIGLAHYDVASIVEMKEICAINPNAVLHYHNPIRSEAEIEAAYRLYNCRRFVVDSVNELEKLHRVLQKCEPNAAKNTEIAVRLALPQHENSVQDFSKKFGANELEAERTLIRAKHFGYRLGMTFHVGSQCLNFKAYELHIKTCSSIAKRAKIELNFLNVGGGFPASYCTTKAQSILENEAELIQCFATIDGAATKYFKNARPQLECEPGRALVAPSFSLLTTIKTLRHETCELYLNDGIYGGLMEAYQFKELTPNHIFHSQQSGQISASECLWTAYGPTCDPCDVLPLPISLPKNLCEGDRIEFLGIGAYSHATTTRFNGYGDLKLVECE